MVRVDPTLARKAIQDITNVDTRVTAEFSEVARLLGINLNAPIPVYSVNRPLGLNRSQGLVHREAAITAATSTMYTVTAGKTLYVTSVTLQQASTVDATVLFRDGGAAGSIVLRIRTGTTSGAFKSFVFPTPIQYDTSFFVDASDALLTVLVNFEGFEEVT